MSVIVVYIKLKFTNIGRETNNYKYKSVSKETLSRLLLLYVRIRQRRPLFNCRFEFRVGSFKTF